MATTSPGTTPGTSGWTQVDALTNSTIVSVQNRDTSQRMGIQIQTSDPGAGVAWNADGSWELGGGGAEMWLTIAAAFLGQGPSTGFYTGAPAGAIFDFVNYTGQTDVSNMDNSDCRGHVYTSSTSQQNWNWVITSHTSNSSASSAVHYLAP